MYEVARCCRCSEAVRLPANATLWVRCPHCHAEYPIDQILEKLPPALEEIAAPASADLSSATLHSHKTNASAAESDSEGKVKIASVGSGVSLITRPSSKVVIDEGKARVRSPDRLRAERRKTAVRRNHATDQLGIAKVFLGGIAGLMIGQLILWWLPKPYRTDPLELAPKLPSALAFFSPASLRVENPTLLDPDTQYSLKGKDDKSQIVPKVDSDVLTNIEAARPPQVEPDNTQIPQKVVIGETESPSFTIEEVKEALTKAREVDRKLSSELSLSSDWYAPLRELAHRITYADPTQPNMESLVRSAAAFSKKLLTSESKELALGRMASGELNNSAFDRSGMMIAGKVKAISKAGEHFHRSRIALTGGKQVDVISRGDPIEQGHYTAGDRVVVLGVIVAEPELYLIGYKGEEGDAKPIVFAGLPVRL